MTIAICQQVWQVDPTVQIVVPGRFGSYQDRARYGLQFHDEFPRSKLVERVWASLTPASVRKIVGMVRSSEISAVLDASGFAYSDQWGAKHAESLLRKMNRRHRRSQPLYILPQAFGPFQDSAVRSATRQLFERANWIAARDSVSYEYAKPIAEPSKLFQYPDFTLGLTAAPLVDVSVPDSFVAIVPNLRMTDMTGAGGGSKYLSLLVLLFREIEKLGETPVLLLHDAAEDRRVVPELTQRLGSFPIITHSDPLVLKAILGQARLVISSRFHALASALSQGTPSLALGWSHKYEQLLRDFECSDMRIDLEADEQTTRDIIAKSIESAGSGTQRQLLQAASARLKSQINGMWSALLAEILR